MLRPAGSFKVSDLDDTTARRGNYGALLLEKAWYFNKQKRFWMEQDFQNAQTVRARIAAKLKAIGIKRLSIEGSLRHARRNAMNVPFTQYLASNFARYSAFVSWALCAQAFVFRNL